MSIQWRLLLVICAVVRYHVIDGRRCEVKKALTKLEMESLKSVTSAASIKAVPPFMNSQMTDPGQGFGPYGTPADNMGFQQANMGSWSQGAGSMDENAAAGNFGYMGAPSNHSMNAPCGQHMCGMNLGSMAGMLGSMLASMGAQGANMSNMTGAPGMNMAPSQNAGNMPGQNCFLVITFTLRSNKNRFNFWS